MQANTNPNQRWTRWAISILAGMSLTLPLGCTGTSESSAPEGDRLEFWTMQLQPQFTDYFNQRIETFEADRPELEVQWTDVPWSAMESKILTAVSAQTAPDAVNLNPNFAALLAGRQAWLDLDDRISEQTRQQYLPNIWEANAFETCDDTGCETSTFGIPWYLSTRVVIYNTDLFEQAGIEQPPATYSELAQVAKQVYEQTGKYAFFVTFAPGDSSEVLESMVQMGVRLLDEEGKAAFNTPEGKAAFEYWVKLYRDGLLPRESLTQGHRRAIELYQAGEIALLASGPQFFQTIAQNAPDIAQVSEAAPQITGKTGKKTVAVMNLVIPKNSDRPEDAIEFALFLTNAENQLEFAKQAKVLPSAKAALADPYFQTIAEQGTQVEKALAIGAQQLEDAEVLLPMRDDINELQRIIYDNLQAAMLEEKTVEAAIADAEQQWNNR